MLKLKLQNTSVCAKSLKSGCDSLRKVVVLSSKEEHLFLLDFVWTSVFFEDSSLLYMWEELTELKVKTKHYYFFCV